MYLSLLPASLLLSLAAAQTTTTQSVISVTSAAAGTASVCAAQPVLEACLASTEAIAGACSSTDYQCLCSKWNDVLTCFNDCPNDARYSSVLSNQETYCNDMSVYASTTTTAISRAVSSSGSAATTTGAGSSDSQTTGSAGAVQTASGTSSSASSTSTGKSGAGSNMMIGAGQVVLGLAGVVGVLL